MNYAVAYYIWAMTDVFARPLNLDIIDPVAQDFRADLTPAQREAAEFEVDLLNQCSSFMEYERMIRVIHRVNGLAARLDALEAAASS